MHDNGLIYSGQQGKALTWMDAVVEGVPVTPRIGYAVEINALWYFAITYTLELAKKNNDDKLKHLDKTIKEQFTNRDLTEELKNVFLSQYDLIKQKY